jgi:hypothetical protein
VKGSIILVLLICGLALSQLVHPVEAQYIELDTTADVWVVIDGDTFDAFPVGRIRLADIDAPDQGETGYDTSRNYLDGLIDEKQIYLDVDDTNMHDSYRRLICVAYVRKNTTHLWNINKKMLVENYAVENDFTNNEFNPDTWTETVYYPTSDLPARYYPQLLSDYLQLTDDYDGLQDQYSSLQTQYNQKVTDYNTLFTQYSSLFDDFHELNSTYHTLLTNHNQLQTDYNQKVAEYNDLLTQYTEINNTIFTLLLNHDLNMSYVDLLIEYDGLNTTHEALNDQYENLNTTHMILEDDHEELQTDFVTLESQYDTLNGTYLQLQTDYSNLQTQYEQSASAVGLYQPLSYILIAVSVILGVVLVVRRSV